ncbi:hypothetical protein HK101_006748, partial [Irineochytrium annulatum]
PSDAVYDQHVQHQAVLMMMQYQQQHQQAVAGLPTASHAFKAQIAPSDPSLQHPTRPATSSPAPHSPVDAPKLTRSKSVSGRRPSAAGSTGSHASGIERKRGGGGETNIFNMISAEERYVEKRETRRMEVVKGEGKGGEVKRKGSKNVGVKMMQELYIG